MGFGNYRPLTASGGTAKTLILVGLIFELIFALIYLFGVGLLSLLTVTAAIAGANPAVLLVSGLFIGLGLIGFIILYLIYALSYRRTRNGEYQEARTPTLIFAILTLVTLNFIAGILYLVAYVKLGDAVREQAQQIGFTSPMSPASSYNPSAPASPATAPAPGVAPTPNPAPYCSKCGKPTTWVAQYQRYYCYRCSQYA